MKELWLPIAGYEGIYEISDFGHIRRVTYGTKHPIGYVFNSKPTKMGYLRVTLRKDGKRQSRFIHVLVLEAFDPPHPPDMETNHKNGDKSDNRLENLEWASHSKNLKHAYSELGSFHPQGEQCGSSKLTANQVREIRQLYATGTYTQAALGKQFSVTDVMISNIVNRRSWRHL